jgi:hypothetical protein
MLAEFSFLRHPLEKILRYSRQLVPGIQRVDIFYFDEASASLVAKSLTNDMEMPIGKLMDIRAIKPQIEKFRRKRGNFEWFLRKELPWIVPDHENINKDMEDELNSFILMIPVESNEQERLNDLIFFHFNQNLSNLKMTGGSDISVDKKDLVARVYLNAVKAMITAAREDSEIWEDFAPAYRNNRETIENLRLELKQMRRMYQERLIASCRFYLAKLSVQYGRQFEFKASAIELIKNYEGEYFRLENAIKSSVRITQMTELPNSQDIIEISEGDLNFNTAKRIEEINDAHLQSELEKPFRYLNQLEEKCLKLQAENRPITGKNVAMMMEPPVQAPSITMYLNSNQEKVLKLFNFYGEKWKILRTGFKPTFNLLENSRNRPIKR